MKRLLWRWKHVSILVSALVFLSLLGFVLADGLSAQADPESELPLVLKGARISVRAHQSRHTHAHRWPGDL